MSNLNPREARFVSRIRCAVRRHRSYHVPISRVLAIRDQQPPERVVSEFAERAAVDWLYNEGTGEVAFFEFA